MRPRRRGTYEVVELLGCAASGGGCDAGAEVAMKLCSPDILPAAERAVDGGLV